MLKYSGDGKLEDWYNKDKDVNLEDVTTEEDTTNSINFEE